MSNSTTITEDIRHTSWTLAENEIQNKEISDPEQAITRNLANYLIDRAGEWETDEDYDEVVEEWIEDHRGIVDGEAAFWTLHEFQDIVQNVAQGHKNDVKQFLDREPSDEELIAKYIEMFI